MDEILFSELSNYSKQDFPKFFLHLDGESYLLTNVSIEKSSNPVSKPTSRGGVYLSGKFSYRLKGTINDVSIIPKLSKTMLGPKHKFIDLKITTKNALNKSISIFANLTSSMHNSSKIDLNMVVVRVEN